MRSRTRTRVGSYMPMHTSTCMVGCREQEREEGFLLKSERTEREKRTEARRRASLHKARDGRGGGRLVRRLERPRVHLLRPSKSEKDGLIERRTGLRIANEEKNLR